MKMQAYQNMLEASRITAGWMYCQNFGIGPGKSWCRGCHSMWVFEQNLELSDEVIRIDEEKVAWSITLVFNYAPGNFTKNGNRKISRSDTFVVFYDDYKSHRTQRIEHRFVQSTIIT